MQDISLHILDVTENGIVAGASRIEIAIREDSGNDELHVEIVDNGRGMTDKELERARDPFYTTKPGKNVGLGLALLAQAAREGGGEMTVTSRPENGTHIHAIFKYSHPDRKPLGDIEGTVKMLRITHPEIEFVYTRG